MMIVLSRKARGGIRVPILALAVAAALMGCSGGESGGSGGGHPAATQLGLDARLARAPDPGAAACSRVESVAETIVGEIAAADALSAGFSASFKSALAPWVETFGRFNGLLYGEVRRTHELFLIDGTIDSVEAQILALALGEHARFAGVAKTERRALGSLVAGLVTPAGTPEAGLLSASLLENVGHLFSALETCSPETGGNQA